MMFDRRLVIVTGKGGVGKSAVAAALALTAHREGSRVLAMSLVGTGGGLASHLGAAPLTFDPQEVRPGLSALVVERTRALVEYLETQANVPAFATFGPFARAFDAIASAAPAVREIVTIGKLLWEVKREAWDLVVADGPPTGQIGSFLRAARTISELVPTGRIRDQAAWMDAILLDAARTELVIVTIPEELPTAETEEALAWLDEEQVVGSRTVVANRVLPSLARPARLPEGPVGSAARLHLDLVADQAEWLAELPPDQRLPFLFGVFTPQEVAAQLADEVAGWDRGAS
jgi:anion-transporting  ArsA/GET3 family ATPase